MKNWWNENGIEWRFALNRPNATVLLYLSHEFTAFPTFPHIPIHFSLPLSLPLSFPNVILLSLIHALKHFQSSLAISAVFHSIESILWMRLKNPEWMRRFRLHTIHFSKKKNLFHFMFPFILRGSPIHFHCFLFSRNSEWKWNKKKERWINGISAQNVNITQKYMASLWAHNLELCAWFFFTRICCVFSLSMNFYMCFED